MTSQFAQIFSIDETKPRNMINLNWTENNINELERFDELIKTFDKSKAKAHFEGTDKSARPIIIQLGLLIL